MIENLLTPGTPGYEAARRPWAGRFHHVRPAAIASPRAASASYTGPSSAPAPVVTWSPCTWTASIGPTSTSRPGVDERPAKQCPPLRGAIGSPCARATASVSATSSGVRQRTTAAGRASRKRASGGLRADS